MSPHQKVAYDVFEEEDFYLALNIQGGSRLQFSDGSSYEVAPKDRIYSSAWLSPFPVQMSESYNLDYPVIITNLQTTTSVLAKPITQEEFLKAQEPPPPPATPAEPPTPEELQKKKQELNAQLEALQKQREKLEALQKQLEQGGQTPQLTPQQQKQIEEILKKEQKLQEQLNSGQQPPPAAPPPPSQPPPAAPPPTTPSK